MTTEARIRFYSIMVVMFPVLIAMIVALLKMDTQSPVTRLVMYGSLLGSAGFFLQAFRLERAKK